MQQTVAGKFELVVALKSNVQHRSDFSMNNCEANLERFFSRRFKII